MRGSYYRSTIGQGKTVDTETDEDDAKSKRKSKIPLLGRSTTTRLETSNDSDSTKEDSSSSSGKTLPKAIYPLQVAKARKAQTQSTINPTQLTRAMSNLAINRQHVPEDVIEISD
jgi:hypothetical protein